MDQDKERTVLAAGAEDALRERTHQLRERVKELDCLYGISQLVETPGISLDEILQGTAHLIPLAWQYPEITNARIILEGREFKSENFEETAWQQASDITVRGKQAGRVEVSYREERREIDEGPFLEEERKLLNAIAERLGRIVERVRAEEALRESEETARVLFNATVDIIVLLDRQGIIIDANETMAHRFGKQVHELLGTCVWDLFPPDVTERRKAIVEQVFHSGKPIRFEDERHGIWNDNVINPVFDAQGKVVRVATWAHDITERVQAEKALQESEKLLRAIAANYPAYLSVIEKDDRDLTIGFTSGREFVERNLDPGSFDGLPLEDVFGDHTPTVRENYLKAFGGEEVSFELFVDNQYQLYNVVPLYDEHGEVHRILSVVNNITESRQAEAALRESEEKYRNLVEKVSDVIYVIDTEGLLTFVSPAIEPFLGYSPSEVVGQPFAQFIAPEDLPRIRDSFQQLSSGKFPGPTNEYRVVTKSGEVRWMRTSSQPVVEGDQITGVQGVLTDITGRKQTEETLRESEQLLQSALDALSANIAVLDDSGTIIAVNASWRTFGDKNGLAWTDYGVGRSYLAVADSASGDCAEGAQEAAQGIRELLSGQRDQFSLQYPCHSPSQQRWFTMRATRFESNDGVRVAVSHENITERVRAEQQLEEAAAAAERERLARELHDAVTQVLFSASLIADTLPRVWERHPEQGQLGLEELRRLTHGALAEMRTLLLELRPGALSEQDLGTLLRQLTDGMMARTRMPVATTVVGNSSLPTDVQIALYRIAQEALNNVAKHAQASRAKVSLENEPGCVTLHISDDGRGFDMGAAQPHQLGMQIMRERAQAIGASIRVKSQPGQGTELVVTWAGDSKTKSE